MEGERGVTPSTIDELHSSDIQGAQWKVKAWCYLKYLL